MLRCPKCTKFGYSWDPVRMEWRCPWNDCRYSPGFCKNDSIRAAIDRHKHAIARERERRRKVTSICRIALARRRVEHNESCTIR